MEVFEILIGALAIVGVFLIIREFWCWFYKSNEILNRIKELSQKVDDLSKNH